VAPPAPAAPDPQATDPAAAAQPAPAAAAAPAAPTLAERLQARWFSPLAPPLLLRPLALLFGALAGTRRALYRAGLLRAGHPGVPVIVVGNRIVGGAGKTPVTIALVEALRARGWRPAVVSRGYGTRADARRAVRAEGGADEAAAVGDEPLLIARRTGAAVWVGRDRLAAAQAVRAAHPAVDVIVCDDGAQHLRLARDIDVLVFDDRGAGNGALLPAGPLREPLGAAAAGATLLVLYNAPAPSTALPGHVARRHLGAPRTLQAWWAGEAPPPGGWAALQGRPVRACAGIAHPERFFAALRAEGLVVQALPLRDHDDFATLPWPRADAPSTHTTPPPGKPPGPPPRDVLLTEKDAIKLDPARVARERPGDRVWVVPMELALPAPFVDALFAALGPRPPGAPR
jgi:tetraacyldisaccharide 4'-kinase